jgi:hypothetical protein
MENQEKKLSVFETLNSINVNGNVEKKNGLTYLSWAWAWAEVMKKYPNSTYKVYTRDMIIDSLGNVSEVNYFTDGKTAWCKCGVEIEGKEIIEMLPIMDYKNKAIPLEQVEAMAVNKTIQRCLTKAIARHGLGLYIYAGEDLPESEQEVENTKRKEYIDYIKEHTSEYIELYKAKGKSFNSNLESEATEKLKNMVEYGKKLFDKVGK